MARWAATAAANAGGAVHPLYPAESRFRRVFLVRVGCLGALGTDFGLTKVEGRFAPQTLARLRELGHEVEVLADFSEAMGHAGAIVRHPDGLFEGASDPRSNGAAAGY